LNLGAGAWIRQTRIVAGARHQLGPRVAGTQRGSAGPAPRTAA